MSEEVQARPSVKVLGTAMLLACAHQYLFYGHQPGVSVILFVVLFYSYIYLFSRPRLKPRLWSPFNLLILPVVLLLSLRYALFDASMFSALNLLLIPVMISAQLVYLLGERKGGLSLIGVRRSG
ncbi:hypothetical protein Q5741_11110 [Paenibacillus sp. JX-17]|uniref:Acyltransferase 3 domain-containing protein n=1 Tax=Paenibacillus lacisoli TaxID=3064525 RepID=A0ABT9CCH2_9BACL|nr:hypothetical protein [Paenibacillus sp. JX-17]MDO7906964.1 hypothetical protein [Paenibacillus sp. JX-17]